MFPGLRLTILALTLFNIGLAVPLPTTQNPVSSATSKNAGITSKDWISSVCKNSHSGIIPWDKPVISWTKRSKTSPQKYMKPFPKPFGKDVAAWQHKFFAGGSLEFRETPEVKPLRADAPTMISIFYPDPKQFRRPITTYLKRIQKLADTGEQMIMYVPGSLVSKIRAMRKDHTHWKIIDLDTELKISSVDDFPNVKEQMSYIDEQEEKFKTLDGVTGNWKPQTIYSSRFLASVYHAKWYVVWDAVMRNPFGSKSWMYIDAGIYDESGPRGENIESWSEIIGTKPFLDPAKFARSLHMTGDSGVAMPQYPQSKGYDKSDFNNDCWTNPTHIWRCHQFIAHIWVGSSLGMLEFSAKYMQTVDDMNANGIYTGREEFNIPFVAARYPNTVFGLPWHEAPQDKLKVQDEKDPRLNWWPAKVEYTSWGGPKYVSGIDDPLDTLFCPASTGYKPRKANLAQGQVLA